MRNHIRLIVILCLFLSCKSNSITQTKEVSTEPTAAYMEQTENMQKGIYFRGVGNEPEWSLIISNEMIDFTSLKPGFESFKSVAVEPVRAMDANVKMYRVKTESGSLSIQIQQEECINSMSGETKPYTVKVEISNKKATNQFKGCGFYVTDFRLHDIWVLEKLNGIIVGPTDFMKEKPYLEINSSNNNFIGFAGCNRMNGTVFFEKGLLRFTNVSTTRMACPGNNKEGEFLKTLRSTITYKIENRRLTVSSPSGAELVFRKVD